MPILPPCSVMECPSDMVPHPSMTTEIEELLSSTMFNMSGQLPIGISPRKPTSMGPDVPTTSGGEIPFEPGKIDLASLKEILPSPQESSQVGMANDTAHNNCSPSPSPMLGTSEATSVPSALQSQTSPRANSISLSDKVLHLQEEMNNAMSRLLTTQTSLDTHQQRLISDTETTLCQNKAKASEAVKEVKACCTALNPWGQGLVCSGHQRGRDHPFNLHHGSRGCPHDCS